MIVKIGTDGSASLEDANNFRAFRIDAPADVELVALSDDLADFITLENDDVAWVSEAWLRNQGGDATWRGNLGAMIEKARPHGWIRDTPALAIRAHVQRV